MESDGEEQEITDLSNSDVLAKYQFAADVANKVVGQIAEKAVPGKKVCELCQLGDSLIDQLVTKSFTKGKMEKGVAFPTSLSVNSVCGNFCPLMDDTTTLAPNDILKIDLGVHVDGFVAVVAHTMVVTDGSDELTGRKGDVVCAALTAMDAVCKMVRPGTKNTDITEVIQQVAEAYHVVPVEGVLSHEMKRFVIDGNNVIINKPTQENRVEEFTIAENEVYAIDIMMSTGEGKPKTVEAKTTIFKRSTDQQYRLKLQASRYLLNEINKKFPTFPFTLRAVDQKKGKLGVTEMLSHQMIDPYPVLQEKGDAVVAHFKTTLLVKKKATAKATVCSVRVPHASSSYTYVPKAVQSEEPTAVKAPKPKKKKSKKKKVTTATVETPVPAEPADSAPPAAFPSAQAAMEAAGTTATETTVVPTPMQT